MACSLGSCIRAQTKDARLFVHAGAGIPPNASSRQLSERAAAAAAAAAAACECDGAPSGVALRTLNTQAYAQGFVSCQWAVTNNLHEQVPVTCASVVREANASQAQGRVRSREAGLLPGLASESGGSAQVSLGAGGRADMRGVAVRAAVEARGPSEDEEAAPLADGGPRKNDTSVQQPTKYSSPPWAGPACRYCEQRRRSHARRGQRSVQKRRHAARGSDMLLCVCDQGPCRLPTIRAGQAAALMRRRAPSATRPPPARPAPKPPSCTSTTRS